MTDEVEEIDFLFSSADGQMEVKSHNKSDKKKKLHHKALLIAMIFSLAILACDVVLDVMYIKN